VVLYGPVGLEFVVKPPSEAGRVRGNAFANGNIPSQRFWFWVSIVSEFCA
jgi:hypothetical protein